MSIEQQSEEKETSEYSTGMTGLDYKEFAQARRINFIQRIEKATEGELERLEPDDKGHYLAAIRDVEKQALVIEKMRQDKELAMLRLKADEQNSAAVNQNIATLLNTIARNKGNPSTLLNNQIDEPDITKIPQKSLIEGETMIGDQLETYQQFQKRTGFDTGLDPEP